MPVDSTKCYRSAAAVMGLEKYIITFLVFAKLKVSRSCFFYGAGQQPFVENVENVLVAVIYAGFSHQLLGNYYSATLTI